MTSTAPSLRPSPVAEALAVVRGTDLTKRYGEGDAAVTGSRAGVLTWLARQDPSGVHGDALPALTRGL